LRNSRSQGRLFPYSNHNPDFLVDLPAVTLGAQINTVAALALLGSKP
jgi:hippurate hydrolase